DCIGEDGGDRDVSLDGGLTLTDVHARILEHEEQIVTDCSVDELLALSKDSFGESSAIQKFGEMDLSSEGEHDITMVSVHGRMSESSPPTDEAKRNQARMTPFLFGKPYKGTIKRARSGDFPPISSSKKVKKSMGLDGSLRAAVKHRSDLDGMNSPDLWQLVEEKSVVALSKIGKVPIERAVKTGPDKDTKTPKTVPKASLASTGNVEESNPKSE
ncbi:hypothetical protein FF38_09318, partial [Lucilia cuprina]